MDQNGTAFAVRHFEVVMSLAIGSDRDLASEYVATIVEKHAVQIGPASAALRAANEMFPVLREWAGRYLLGIGVSGSYAKGTAITLGTDVDVFVSLEDERIPTPAPQTPATAHRNP
jgi:hypothetical protein